MYYVNFCRAKTGYWVGWTEYNNTTFFTAASTLDELVRRMKTKLYNKYRMSASSIIIAEKQSQVEDCPHHLMGTTFLKRYWGENNVLIKHDEESQPTIREHKRGRPKGARNISKYDKITYEEQNGKLIVYGIIKIAEFQLKNKN